MRRSGRVYDLILKLWPLGRTFNRLGNWPLLAPLLRPCFGSEDNEAIILPVQEAVRGTESVVLPLSLLVPLIERARACFVLDECMCRRGEGCRAYPPGIGCLFLGDGAAQIAPSRGRPAGVGEALAHTQQAMALGLVPMVVHSAFDAWVLDIPYRRALAVCFCCDCCCTVRHGLRLGPPAFWETVVRLPGLSLSVGEACAGCGLCREACPVGAISLRDGRANIGEACKGCGQCAALCPSGAITLHVEDEAAVLARLLARIEQRTHIGNL